MIVRTYGRRNRSVTGRCSDDDADLGSQESSQDVYEFGFPSEEGKESAILPFGRSEDNGVSEGSGEGYFRNSKKAKVGGARGGGWSDDSEGFGFNSSQEAGDFGVLPWRNDREDEDSKGPEGYLWKSDVIKIDDDDDSDPYGLNSLRESCEFNGVFEQSKKKKEKEKGKENGILVKKKNKDKKKNQKSKKEVDLPRPVGTTVTLMETQEFGEMMERMDEVTFALDGLKRGQPMRIRRASLLSLLSICATAQQRRLLRAHGLAKTIMDSILGLSFDDSPSNLAAAALFFVFTSDGQDDHLLDSPTRIRFLLKLLKPLASDAAKAKSSTIGSKLLALRMDPNVSQDTAKGLDSTAAAITHKVQEILVSCKEIRLGDGDDNANEKVELSPKWISLLTMEKACLSTISIEDTSGIVRKTGGNFKEKLRELGGLDAVFEVARKCQTIMEGWSEQSLSSGLKSKDRAGLESLVLLLKCLKIMENATFLSSNNQSHLLEMKGNFDNQSAPRSFVKLILSIIKILSDVSLRCCVGNDANGKRSSQTSGTIHASEMLLTDNKEYSNEILSITSSVRSCTLERTSSQQILVESQKNQRLTSGQPASSRLSSETSSTSAADSWSLKIRLNSSTSGPCSGPSTSSNNGMPTTENGSRLKFGSGDKHKVTGGFKFDFMEESQDPFAFDEDDFEPSKWDLLSGRKVMPQTHRPTIGDSEDGSQSPQVLSQEESNHLEVSSSPIVDEKVSTLLADCLLTAVKVLMNLTNDNPLGCQQIAEGGGLETLSSLIADHFPSFNSCLPPISVSSDNMTSSKSSIEANNLNEGHLSDQELDFLVAILGLLVNLVEKDGRNRSWLAAARVSLPSSECSDEGSHRDVIPLLCSIFLANQGAGEVAGEGKCLSWDDEDAISQGEKEAEKMIIEAYAALLLAFLSTESKSIRNAIAGCLPNRNLAILVPVLERFVEFHLTLNMISPETHTTVLEVIESCRIH